jgi:hypothetical protein
MSTIKINELATTGISLTDFLVKADANGYATKNTMQGLQDFLSTLGDTSFKGTISAGTYATKDAGWYFASNTGNYIMGATTIAVDVSDTLTLIIVPSVINDSSKVEIPLNIATSPTPTENGTDAFSTGGAFTEFAKKADKTYVDEKIDGIVTSVPILDASATYANKQDIEDFIVDFSAVSGFLEAEPIYLSEIKDNGDGTFRLRVKYNSNNVVAWEVVDTIPTGTATFNATYNTTKEANIELNFDNFVSFAYNAGSSIISPVNMDRFINGVSTDVDPNSVVGKIAIAKQEAIDTASSDATSKADTAEQNAKDYADLGLEDKVDFDDYQIGERININSWLQELDLDNLDNTSDLNKPISTATQNALDDKVEYANYNDAIGMDVDNWKNVLGVVENGASEIDPVTIFNREYSTTKEVINGVSGVVDDPASTVFLPSANYATLTELNAFIKEIKVASSSGSNILETDEFFILDIRDEGSNVVRIRLRNNLNAATTVGYFDTTGLTGIQEFTEDNINLNFKVKLDVDNIAYTVVTGTFATLPLDMAKLFTEDAPPVNEEDPNGLAEILDKVSEDANTYADTLVASNSLETISFKNKMVNGDFRSGYDFADHPSQNPTAYPEQSVSGNTDGITFDVDSYVSGAIEVLKYGFSANPNERWGISVEYVINSTDLVNESQDTGFNIRLESCTYNFGVERFSTQNVGEVIRETYIDDMSSSEVATTNGLMGIKFRGDSGQTGTSVNFTIKTITLIYLGTSESDNANYNITESELDSHLRIKGYFPNELEVTGESTESTKIVSVPKANLALHKFNPYYGRYLVVWGHSVVETGGWQEMICNHFGMIFDPQINNNAGVDGYQEAAIGGSYLVPVIADNDTKGAGVNHYMKLRESFAYFDEKYTTNYGTPLHIFMFNFNDKLIGETYVSGGAYTVPADMGINDVSWDYDTYGEVNLVSNPSETNVPTFGAAYRAALDFAFETKPEADIMLLTCYRTQANDDTSINQLNTITELMGVEYCVPVIDFHTTLWSPERQDYFLKDSIHPDWNGKIKMARSAIRQM